MPTPRSVPRLLAVLAVLAAALTAAAPAGASAGTTQYSLHGTEIEDFTDTGLCDESAVAQIHIETRFALHLAATEAGLDDDELEALLDDDPDGIVTKVTYTETGTVTALENGVTYTGRFTNWFGGSVNVFTGIFTVTATGSDGSHVNLSFVAHETEVAHKIDPVVAFEKGHVTGCLAS